MKIVVNKCFGGFGLSRKAVERLAEIEGLDASPLLSKNDIEIYALTSGYNREDKNLVSVVEELGKAASGWAAELVVVDIPDGTEYDIEDYDGVETIHEKHRSW